MTLLTGFRPRGPAPDPALANLLLRPPAGPIPVPDTSTAAAVKVAGGVPVAAPGVHLDADALVRLGLGPPGQGLPDPPADAPLVTILICTFDRAGLLPEAIASARAQRWPVEILVVDDGSTDETPAVLAATAGIRALRQVPNQGKPAALNRGLAAARGAAILVLDDDDRLLPGAVTARATALFSLAPDAAAVVADSVFFDGETGRGQGIRPAARLPGARFQEATLAAVPGMPGATLVRARAQQAAGPYALDLNMLEDVDMFKRLARVGPLAVLPVPVQAYRKHAGARGGAADRSRTDDWRIRRARAGLLRSWRERAPQEGRRAGHHRALGLQTRGLVAEAIEEAGRWPGPWTPEETRIRRHLGLPTPDPAVDGVVVVLHDGDVGALGACLDRHATGAFTRVVLAVPCDTPGVLDNLWPGDYRGDPGLRARLTPPGPWRLRCSADPDWAPPPLPDPALVPDLSGEDADRAALLVTASALGWPPPGRTRACLPPPRHPVLAAVEACVGALEAGQAAVALRALLPVLQAHPGWKGAWRLAARAAATAGQRAQAAAFAARGR